MKVQYLSMKGFTSMKVLISEYICVNKFVYVITGKFKQLFNIVISLLS